MPFNQFPFLRYVIFFILGIWVYPYAEHWQVTGWVILTLSFFGCYAFFLFLDVRFHTRFFSHLLPALAFGVLFFSGIGFAALHDVKHDPQHLLHQGKITGYLALVHGLDDPKSTSMANRVELTMVNKEGQFFPARGTVLLYHRGQERLAPGDLVYVKGEPGRIEAPQNPGEFDYRRFMERQQVYHRHFVSSYLVKLKQKHPLSWRQRVALFREDLSQRIDAYLSDSRASQIAKALLLGQKDSMEPTLRDAYVTAGTMHVLAVSGLHVGIVYGFFFLLWKPNRLPFIRRCLFLTAVIGVVWSYAIITGLSPSVLRAATMFTLVGFAQMNSRNPSIFNPLAISALLLVLYDPFVVYAVGFQLSYTALLGILVFQPVIVSWWNPTSKLADYFWQIASTSLAAQLGTFPLTLHYFHSFPTYFLFSNLLAIPGAFLIMVIGISFLLLSPFSFAASWLGKLLEGLIYIFNQVMFSVQYLPKARLDNLYLDLPEVWGTWLLFGTFFWWLVRRSKLAYRLTLLTFGLLVCYRFWIVYDSYTREDPIIYKLSKGVAVDWFHRGVLYAYQQNLSTEDFSYKVLPNRIKRRFPPSLALFGVESGGRTFLLSPGGEWFMLDNEHGILSKWEEPVVLSDPGTALSEHLDALQAKDYTD